LVVRKNTGIPIIAGFSRFSPKKVKLSSLNAPHSIVLILKKKK
jgi:hypothetical protein